jgi:hypothetical protein
MRRGLRGLPIVLGLLWVAAAADAITLMNMEASPAAREFLGLDQYDGGGYPRVWLTTGGQMPNSQQFFVPGATQVPYRHDFFGRRTFIWHTDGADDGFQPSGLLGALRPNLFLRRSLAELSWETLRRLVWGLPHRYDPLLPGFVDRWGSGLGIGESGASFAGRIEWRSDRVHFDVSDFYGDVVDRWGGGLGIGEPGASPGWVSAFPPRSWSGVGLTVIGLSRLNSYPSDPSDFYFPSASVASGVSASVASHTALVPEPGTGVLLLAGLCALAMTNRRRRRRVVIDRASPGHRLLPIAFRRDLPRQLAGHRG